jgi:hypothetical protein
MRFLPALSLILMMFTVSAEAKTLRLSYDGLPLLLQGTPRDRFSPPFFSPFTGSIILSEAAYGSSFANSTVSFYGIYGPGDPANQTDGIVEWNFTFPLYSVGGSTIRFTFGPTYELLGWSLSALDGPPDYGMGISADTAQSGFGDSYSAPAQAWTVQAVPIPGTIGLLAAGLGMLAGFAHRRQSRLQDLGGVCAGR